MSASLVSLSPANSTIPSPSTAFALPSDIDEKITQVRADNLPKSTVHSEGINLKSKKAISLSDLWKLAKPEIKEFFLDMFDFLRLIFNIVLTILKNNEELEKAFAHFGRR